MPSDDKQAMLFSQYGQTKPDYAPAAPPKKTAGAARATKWPKLLDPALLREVI